MPLKNILTNLYSKLESNTEYTLTPTEQMLADSSIWFFESELVELNYIISEEKKAQEDDEKNPPIVPREKFDLEKMQKFVWLIESVINGLNFLSSRTNQLMQQRSRSTIVRTIMTPEQMCNVRGTRKLDMSAFPPVMPHEIQDVIGKVPIKFKQQAQKIHRWIEQENLFGSIGPIFPPLGKNIQQLYVITDKYSR